MANAQYRPRKQTIKDFKTQTQIEMITPQEDTTLQALEATQEGLQNENMKTQHPTIIPTAYYLNIKDNNTTNQTSPKPLDT